MSSSTCVKALLPTCAFLSWEQCQLRTETALDSEPSSRSSPALETHALSLRHQTHMSAHQAGSSCSFSMAQPHQTPNGFVLAVTLAPLATGPITLVSLCPVSAAFNWTLRLLELFRDLYGLEAVLSAFTLSYFRSFGRSTYLLRVRIGNFLFISHFHSVHVIILLCRL